MKLELVIWEYQDLETHLNLRRDFTGSPRRMSKTMSSGTCFFRSRRSTVVVVTFFVKVFFWDKISLRVLVFDFVFLFCTGLMFKIFLTYN